MFFGEEIVAQLTSQAAELAHLPLSDRYLEDGRWKARYRIKDEAGKWRGAPVHVLGTKRGFPKRAKPKLL
jgi:hypothetical protein